MSCNRDNKQTWLGCDILAEAIRSHASGGKLEIQVIAEARQRKGNSPSQTNRGQGHWVGGLQASSRMDGRLVTWHAQATPIAPSSFSFTISFDS